MQAVHNNEGAPRALVFGGSGQIGARVIALLCAQGWQVVAFSRAPQAARPGVEWRDGALPQLPAPAGRFAAIFSCGPLDLFTQWYAATQIDAARVVAFGSTSVGVKQDSPDPAERDVARRLAQAEATLFARAGALGVAATVLRPTLVYGAGADRTLTQIAALARRTRFFVLPSAARGLRQPVHVQDLAEAALAVLAHPRTAGRAYALGGGEVLGYAEMVRRVLACQHPAARLWTLPRPLFVAALRLAQAGGRLQGVTPAVLARMGEDLVFDLAPARADFGYAPRPFVASAAMFAPACAQ